MHDQINCTGKIGVLHLLPGEAEPFGMVGNNRSTIQNIQPQSLGRRLWRLRMSSEHKTNRRQSQQQSDRSQNPPYAETIYSVHSHPPHSELARPNTFSPLKRPKEECRGLSPQSE